MTKVNIFKIIACLCILATIWSCWSGSDKITNEVEGVYAFQFPDGNYQILTVRNDSTFIQKYFKDYDSFKNNNLPVYTSHGKWSVANEHELSFDNWLEYCYLSDPDSILPKPELTARPNVRWYAPSEESLGALIIYDETGYVLEKVRE